MTRGGPEPQPRASITGLLTFSQDGAARVVAPSGATTRGFGGHVAALALAAAYESVPPAKRVRHAHVEFLRPALAGELVRATVTRLTDGRTLARRQVEVAHPGERPAVSLTATFLERELDAASYQPAAPENVPDPEVCTIIHTSPVMTRAAPVADPSRQQVWIRPEVTPLGADRALHDCALIFVSDLTVLWPTLTVHGRSIEERHAALASISHSVWFHRDADLDDWLLYDQTAVSTSHGLGQVGGSLWSRTGDLVATVVQVGVLNPPVGR